MPLSARKLTVVALSLAPLAAIPATANAQTSTAVRITNQNSNKALTESNGSIVQRTFNGTTSQKWAMISVGNVGGSKVAFRYRNIASGKCLDIEAPGSGRRLVTRPCVTGKFSQQWVRDFSQNTTFLATVNRSSKLAMSVRDRSKLDGASIIQESSLGGTHQKWSVFGV